MANSKNTAKDKPTMYLFTVGGRYHSPKDKWVYRLVKEAGVQSEYRPTPNGMALFLEEGGSELVGAMIHERLNKAITLTLADVPENHPFFNEALGLTERVEDEDLVLGLTATEDPTPEQVENNDSKAEALGDVGDLYDEEEEDEDEETDDEEETEAKAPKIELEPGREYLKIEELVKASEIELPGLKSPIKMFECDSSNVSSIGTRSIKDDDKHLNVYVTFKGGSVYRYKAVPNKRARAVLNEVVKKLVEPLDDAHSIGKAYHQWIKEDADAGNIECSKLNDEGKWVKVQPKASKKKEG